MKSFLSIIILFVSIATNAQTDSIPSAMAYIKEMEKKDPNMRGVKRSIFKKNGAQRFLDIETTPVRNPKNKNKS